MEKRSDDLRERFIQYLEDERKIEVENRMQADKNRLEASKRIRRIDKELDQLKGGKAL